MADNTYTNISDLPTLDSVGENTWVPVEVAGKQGKKVDLSTIGGSVEQKQADWNQSDSTKPDFIKNKPDVIPPDGKTIVTSSNGTLRLSNFDEDNTETGAVPVYDGTDIEWKKIPEALYDTDTANAGDVLTFDGDDVVWSAASELSTNESTLDITDSVLSFDTSEASDGSVLTYVGNGDVSWQPSEPELDLKSIDSSGGTHFSSIQIAGYKYAPVNTVPIKTSNSIDWVGLPNGVPAPASDHGDVGNVLAVVRNENGNTDNIVWKSLDELNCITPLSYGAAYTGGETYSNDPNEGEDGVHTVNLIPCVKQYYEGDDTWWHDNLQVASLNWVPMVPYPKDSILPAKSNVQAGDRIPLKLVMVVDSMDGETSDDYEYHFEWIVSNN